MKVTPDLVQIQRMPPRVCLISDMQVYLHSGLQPAGPPFLFRKPIADLLHRGATLGQCGRRLLELCFQPSELPSESQSRQVLPKKFLELATDVLEELIEVHLHGFSRLRVTLPNGQPSTTLA